MPSRMCVMEGGKMRNCDSFFCERYHELGLNPCVMVKKGEMSVPLKNFLVRLNAYANENIFDELCEALHLSPETALRHIRVTENDIALQREYPWAYHKKKIHVSKIDALAREARRHSMDYGTYVGMLYLEQEQSVMDRYREYQMCRKLGI